VKRWLVRYIKYVFTGTVDKQVAEEKKQSLEKSPEEVVRDFKKKQETKRNIIIAIVLTILIIYAYNYSDNENSNSTLSPYPVIEEDLTGWIPAEFNIWTDDPNVAWRWLEDNEYKCTLGDSCWGMMVIAKDGCNRSLYAEVSILDKNKVQIGYTNDAASQALPMQKTKLIFNTFEDDAHTARLARISCY
jgi:hypothetical protein